MNEETLKKKTIAELRTLAKQKSIPLRSTLRKTDLIRLILEEAETKKTGIKKAAQVKIKKEAPRETIGPTSPTKGLLMTEEKLKRKTIAELRHLAKARSIPLRSSLRKADLIRLLLEGAGKEKEDRVERPRPQAVVHPAPPAGPYADLPAGYGVNRIAAMARDPAWIYAYWEITPDGLAGGRRRVGDGEAKLTLRVGDLTEGMERASFFDIEVYHRIGNWYIEVGRGGRTFVVEIGVKSRAGEFSALSRSNPTTTPAGRVSDDLSEEWWTVEEGEEAERFALDAGERLTIEEATREELAASSGWLVKPSSK
jgi:hypothetical protein